MLNLPNLIKKLCFKRKLNSLYLLVLYNSNNPKNINNIFVVLKNNLNNILRDTINLIKKIIIYWN